MTAVQALAARALGSREAGEAPLRAAFTVGVAS